MALMDNKIYVVVNKEYASLDNYNDDIFDLSDYDRHGAVSHQVTFDKEKAFDIAYKAAKEELECIGDEEGIIEVHRADGVTEMYDHVAVIFSSEEDGYETKVSTYIVDELEVI